MNKDDRRQAKGMEEEEILNLWTWITALCLLGLVVTVAALVLVWGCR